MAFIRELSGHIPLTDENLETSVPGVYAAGDVSGIEEASSAMVEGRIAGCAAAESLGYEPVRAAAEKEAARSELSELRSGPSGARILSGLEKPVNFAWSMTCAGKEAHPYVNSDRNPG